MKEIAERNAVSLSAVEHLLQAMESSHGSLAQFNHPDLGGMGQWSKGGMLMIGDMFNDKLKAKVAAICAEVAELVNSNKADGMRRRRSRSSAGSDQSSRQHLVAGRTGPTVIDGFPEHSPLCLLS